MIFIYVLKKYNELCIKYLDFFINNNNIKLILFDDYDNLNIDFFNDLASLTILLVF
jgi:hypothetical protein